MTLLQIQHAVSCAELGSLTKSAAAMFTSVSNISKSISSLEAELGFTLFQRSASGLVPTEKGDDFLLHAYTILSECRQIAGIKKPSTTVSLSVACTQLPQAFIAYERFCKSVQHESSISTTLFCCPFPECVNRIIKHKSQLAIVSMPLSVDSLQKKHLHDANIVVKHLCKQTLNVNVRAGHPVLAHYTPGEPFDFSLLKEYPYVSYMNPTDCAADADDFSQSSFFSLDAANSPKRFHVNIIDWKSTIVSNTDAFSIGIAGPLTWKHRYGWECIPLPDYESNMYCLYSQSEPLGNEASQYLSALADVLKMPLG